MRSFRLAAIGLLLAGGLRAQDPIGTWRGTSKCLVRPSACNDEIAVYHITRIGDTDSLSIDGRRVVNGDELEMGVLTCHFVAAMSQITCVIPRGKFFFAVRGDSLVGELRTANNARFRDIRLARSR